MARRLAGPFAGQGIKRDAPYRRVGPASGEVHRPVLLNLETSDGSGQACHPDVVFIRGGFGSKGWPYWMVCTPYPYKDNRVENPEVFASYDGIFWTVPDGARNPLVRTPKVAGDHNSDPDVVFHENQLWLFYRETRKSKEPKKMADTNIIYRIQSKDGVEWTRPAEVLRDSTGKGLLSPAVIHDGNSFRMWTVDFDGQGLRLVRRSSPDGVKWSAPQTGTLAGLEPGRQPWHIDVIKEDGRLSAVLVSCTGLGGSGTRIHYAHSEEDGLTWFAEGFLLERIYEFESNLQYRASLLKADPGASEYELWYSASSHSDVFSIAYVRLARVGSKLTSCGCRAARRESLIEP